MIVRWRKTRGSEKELTFGANKASDTRDQETELNYFGCLFV